MHYMTYFNRTDAELHGYWHIAAALMVVEIFFLFVSNLTYILTLYLIIKTMWHQTNMRNIWALCAIQYFVSINDRAIQAALVLYGVQDKDGCPSIYFQCTSYIRAFCTFIVYFALSAIVLERCFATYFLENYEKKQRPYLGFIIILVMLLNALVCSYTYHLEKTTYGHFVAIMVVNTIAILVNKINDTINKRHYFEILSKSITRRTYSLGERYQIAENIKVCKFVFNSVLCIGLLNMISSVSLIIDNFNVSAFVKNIAVLTYNYSVLIYGFIIVIVIYWHNEEWQAELRELTKRCHSARRTHPEFVSVKSTFGNETHVKQPQHASHYFSMLKKDWA